MVQTPECIFIDSVNCSSRSKTCRLAARLKYFHTGAFEYIIKTKNGNTTKVTTHTHQHTIHPSTLIMSYFAENHFQRDRTI